ncbi:MAG: glutaminyl-peptide cyclotransferase [Dehalococcoidia bacterium]
MIFSSVTRLLLLLIFTAILSAVALISCLEHQRVSPEPTPPKVTQTYSYSVVDSYPHDDNAFTQGLAFHDGVLYEGTGLRGRSSLRKVDLETGEILRIRHLPNQFFGEGTTVFKDSILQLTWQANTGFIYDKHTFDLKGEFSYPTEGWGITHDGNNLIMSDGTSSLYFLDPDSFRQIDRIEVHDGEGPVSKLNELEYINGEIYSNVWQTDRIAIIDPKSGFVNSWIDLSGILDPEDRSKHVDVLNGIAYDSKHDRLMVTGKLWPKIFVIDLIPLEE